MPIKRKKINFINFLGYILGYIISFIERYLYRPIIYLPIIYLGLIIKNFTKRKKD